MKIVIVAGSVAVCLAGIGIGVPAVMAADHPAAPAGPGVPAGWPAGKAAAAAAENRLREAAADRPVVAPDVAPGVASGVASGAASAVAPGVAPGADRPGGAGTRPQAAAVAPHAAYDAGILPLTDGGPFSSAQFVGTNVWNGPAGGRWEVVQAGGAPTDRALGAASPTKAGLFVYTESADPAAESGRHVTGILAPSPDPAGRFTVTKAAGGTLTLALSGSSGTYYFNVATRKFTR